MNNVDDLLLFQLIKRDVEDAFKELFFKYYTPITRFIFQFVRDQSLSEELALDVFSHIWEKRATITVSTNFRSYIFYCAKNKALNHIRREKRYANDITPDVINTLISEEDNTELNELYELIAEAISTLPDKCKEVFSMSRNENLSNKEIAARLDLSVRTVESHIVVAISRIKRYLAKNYAITIFISMLSLLQSTDL